MTRLSSVAFALALLAGISVAAAEATATRKYSYTNVVTVAGVDVDAGQVVVDDGLRGQSRIGVDEDTVVQDAHGAPIPLSALEPWDRVVIDARRELEGSHQGDTLFADRIQLVIGSPGTHRGDAGRFRRDAAIREQVVERLAASRSLQGSDVWVSVADGRVVLRGLVADEAAAERALELARRTGGVREVRSELRTDPTLREWAAIQVKDSALVREVAERLKAGAFPAARIEENWLFGWEVEGDSFEFDVDADMGTVTLRGTVPSIDDAERAIAITRRTPGVRSVLWELDTD